MWSYNYSYPNELYHYGVLGMKWGKRRYQNADGSLNDAGKKRVSKEYKKEMVKAQTAINKTSTDRYVKGYNKTIDEYNNGKIEKFNKTHKSTSKSYMEDYEKQFNKDLAKNVNRMTASELKSNKHYQRGMELCEKYGMLSFDQLAKDNAAAIKAMEK